MQILIGWTILLLGGALYLAQVVSSLNFELAQKIGIQEDPKHSDSLQQRAEKYVAYWDLVTLGWFPVAGVLMIINHELWPFLGLVASGIYLDTSGREAAKFLSFKHEGVRIGTQNQQKVFFASYFVMAGLAIVVLFVSLDSIL